MSDIKRYNIAPAGSEHDYGYAEDEDGGWCLVQDVAKLEAELAKVNAEVQRLRPAQKSHADIKFGPMPGDE